LAYLKARLCANAHTRQGRYPKKERAKSGQLAGGPLLPVGIMGFSAYRLKERIPAIDNRPGAATDVCPIIRNNAISMPPLLALNIPEV